MTYTALGKCTAGGLSWGGGGGVKSDHSATCGSPWWLCRFVLLPTLVTNYSKYAEYNSWVGLRQPEGPRLACRSTRVAVYIRYSPARLPARSIDRSHLWRVRALAKWPRCTAKRRYLLNFCCCFLKY